MPQPDPAETGVPPGPDTPDARPPAEDRAVTLGVVVGAAPTQPPAELVDWVQRAESPLGWTLDRGGLLAEAARRQLTEGADPVSGWLTGQVRAWGEWQAQWLQVTELGMLSDLAELDALNETLGGGYDNLVALGRDLRRERTVRLGAGRAVALVAEASQLGEVLRENAMTGIGIYQVGERSRLRRGFVTGTRPRIVASGETTTVTVSDQMVVTGPEGPITVAGWVLQDDQIAVRNPEGAERLLSGTEGATLARLAPGAVSVELRPARLTAVFANLLIGLTAPLAAAVADGRQVIATTA